MNAQATLNGLARDLVGDGKTPNLYFVTDGSDVVAVVRSFTAAYRQWRSLACCTPLRECALEDRLFGVIANVAPEDDNSARLVVIDDSGMFAQHHPRLSAS